jgi:hypothetical protein
MIRTLPPRRFSNLSQCLRDALTPKTAAQHDKVMRPIRAGEDPKGLLYKGGFRLEK